MKEIYFAGGCFWGTQHYIGQFEGVIATEVGYANGRIANPTYQQVYTDQTEHVECVKVLYDPDVISLATLCRLFFKSIDPLLENRQGNDVGTRYRTGIYWVNEDDGLVAGEVCEEIQKKYKTPLAVERLPLKCFYAGEEYHQDYLVKNPQGYCHLSPSLLKTAEAYARIIRELRMLSDDEKKVVFQENFKAGKGGRTEDRFLGVALPDTLRVAKEYKETPFEVIEWLLESEWHEVRSCAMLILMEKYKKAPDEVVLFCLEMLQ